MIRRTCGLALAGGLLTLSMAAQAFSFEVCDRPKDPGADQRDVMLRFGAVVRDELVASAQDVVLIARSGLDLSKLDVRYSHAGVALRDNDGKPWSVRELYYSCQDHQPRVFDEGMSGFLMGTDNPATGYISLVFLPPGHAQPLRATAVDKHHALGVLGASYSANAYPFSTRHQNCNQWVMELLADAWGAEARKRETDAGARTHEADADARARQADADARAHETNAGARTHETDAGARARETDIDARTRAQRWLRAQGYLPTVFTASAHPMTWLPDLVPWLANDDHPPEELAHNRYNVSMPASIETFVQARVPGATRIEVCHAGRHVVVHRGWDAIAEGCVAGPGDRTLELAPD